MKLHFTPRDDFIEGFLTVNIQDLDLVITVSEAVCMSIISCLKCVVSQSNVCLVLVVVMSCHRGLVDDLVVIYQATVTRHDNNTKSSTKPR